MNEFKIPERTKNVPHILSVKVVIDKIITQELKEDLFLKLKYNAIKS